MSGRAASAGAQPSAGAQRPAEPPPDADPVLRAAWAYFMQDMSQAQIAERLGVSRASVGNYLRQARESGLVRVSVDPAVTARSTLAHELARRFALEAAYLVPDTGEMDGAGALPAVARAAGLWLDDLVPDAASVGVAWGETMHALAFDLPRRSRPDLTIVQLVGSMASPSGFNAEACTSLIAERLGARCVNLYAPAIVSSPKVAETLLAEPVIARQVERLSACNVAVFAVGLVRSDSHVVSSGVATEAELRHYLERDAAGVIAGRFIDKDGEPIPGPLDGRVIGVPLPALRAMARRIVVSAGIDRTTALHAALRGGFATHLVTDIASAKALTEMSGDARSGRS